MLRTIGKTSGMALAGMCLISTLAMAQTTPGTTPTPGGTMGAGREMTCTKVDASGFCIEAKGSDDKMMTIHTEGVKMNERMTCTTSGSDTTCKKVTTVK